MALILAEAGPQRIVGIDPQNRNVADRESADRAYGCARDCPTDIPTGVGVGASGTVYVLSDIENAVYKVTKK